MPDVAVGSFGSALTSAAVGDTLSLLAGNHVTPSSGASRENIAKRVFIQAKDWNPVTTPGKYVTGPMGHNSTDFATRWTGGWSIKAASVVIRGISFEGLMTGGAGSIDIDADNVIFEDCRFSDNYRYIMAHIGATGKRQNVIFRRSRFRGIGNRKAHDHPIYLKTASTAIVEDCLFYENAGWQFHCYTDCDGLIVRRTTVDRCNGGITFSGDSGNTVLGGYQYSTNNVVEDSIFTNAKGGLAAGYGSTDQTQTLMLAQYWYPSTAGVNYLRRSNFWNATTPTGAGRIQSGAPIVVESTVTNVDPQYKDPANGDYTLLATSPCVGKGPSYCQPNVTLPPEPEIPNPVTNITATPGDGQVTLAWANPTTGFAMDGVMVRRSTVAPVSDPANGDQVVFDTTSPYVSTVTDTGLTNGLTYYYSVFVRHMQGADTRWSPVSTVSATPITVPPPPHSDTEVHTLVLADLNAAKALIESAISRL